MRRVKGKGQSGPPSGQRRVAEIVSGFLPYQPVSARGSMRRLERLRRRLGSAMAGRPVVMKNDRKVRRTSGSLPKERDHIGFSFLGQLQASSLGGWIEAAPYLSGWARVEVPEGRGGVRPTS